MGSNASVASTLRASTIHSKGSGIVVDLVVVDLSPKFLAFYETAMKQDLTADERWELWQSLYGVAAVPPTPAGKQMARQLLDTAWDKYPAVLERIKAGSDGIQPSPQRVCERVAQVLEYVGPLAVKLVVFVGCLEDNAFMYRDGDTMVVCIPVEPELQKRALLLPHELAHAVHFAKAQLTGGWERSIATTMVSEGVAMHTTAVVEPGHSVEAYVEYSPGWWKACAERKLHILQGIRPYLSDSASGTVRRFTMGEGSTGLEREAYAAGWWVVGWWLEHGIGLPEIASWPEEEHVEKVACVVDELLKDAPATGVLGKGE